MHIANTPMTSRFLVVCIALFGLTSGAVANAASDDDPPERVARLSLMRGDVSMRPAGTDDWAQASLNRPLTTDDQLWVDRNSRAELQVGSATIHLDEDTAFSFSDLSDDVLQMRITSGALHVLVRRLARGEIVEVDTPHAAVTLTEPGEYHVEVSENGDRTFVKNYDGEAEIDSSGDTLRLRARQQIAVDKNGPDSNDRERIARRGEFDDWANERNQRHARSASSRYVSPDVIGYEDLDEYGEWSDVRDYGYVWYPSRVAVGWSPYRYGHWVWVSPWGWTWVDDAPWGFAPFHYGRWAHIHGRWGWIPGPIRVRAVYAPALVAWVGPAPGLSVSVSIGPSIGWFPLAPREVYVPGYHCSRRHVYSVNYANTVIVNNVYINRAYVNRDTRIRYANRDIRDAVTVTNRESFVSARPVHSNLVRVNDRDMREWGTRNVAPALAPDRASVMGERWNGRDRSVPANFTARTANRDVRFNREPPAARTSFESEQRLIRENDNRPLARRDLWRGENTVGSTRGIGEPNAERANETRNGRPNISAGSNRDPRFEDRPRRVFDRSTEESRPNNAGANPPANAPANAPGVERERGNRELFERNRDGANQTQEQPAQIQRRRPFEQPNESSSIERPNSRFGDRAERTTERTFGRESSPNTDNSQATFPNRTPDRASDRTQDRTQERSRRFEEQARESRPDTRNEPPRFQAPQFERRNESRPQPNFEPRPQPNFEQRSQPTPQPAPQPAPQPRSESRGDGGGDRRARGNQIER